MKDPCRAVKGARLWMRPFVSMTLSSISPIDSVHAYLRFLHGGLLSFRPRQHYHTTPAQLTSVHASPPQSRLRSPRTGAPIHLKRCVVLYRTRLASSSLLISSFSGADSPFHTISEVVWTIGSQFSEYEFNGTLSTPQCT